MKRSRIAMLLFLCTFAASLLAVGLADGENHGLDVVPNSGSGYLDDSPLAIDGNFPWLLDQPALLRCGTLQCDLSARTERHTSPAELSAAPTLDSSLIWLWPTWPAPALILVPTTTCEARAGWGGGWSTPAQPCYGPAPADRAACEGYDLAAAQHALAINALNDGILESAEAQVQGLIRFAIGIVRALPEIDLAAAAPQPAQLEAYWLGFDAFPDASMSGWLCEAAQAPAVHAWRGVVDQACVLVVAAQDRWQASIRFGSQSLFRMVARPSRDRVGPSLKGPENPYDRRDEHDHASRFFITL